MLFDGAVRIEPVFGADTAVFSVQQLVNVKPGGIPQRFLRIVLEMAKVFENLVNGVEILFGVVLCTGKDFL